MAVVVLSEPSASLGHLAGRRSIPSAPDLRKRLMSFGTAAGRQGGAERGGLVPESGVEAGLSARRPGVQTASRTDREPKPEGRWRGVAGTHSETVM